MKMSSSDVKIEKSKLFHQYTYIKATLCIIGKAKLNQSLQPKQRKFSEKTLGLLIATPFILKTGVKI